MAVKPIPEGYNTLTAYLAVEDADRAIEFYKDAFGAEELFRMPAPDGRIGHAELQIGDSKLMLSDPFPQSNVRPPSERGGATASIFMYCEDVDSAFEQAKKAGRDRRDGAREHVLGRPLRHARGSVRARSGRSRSTSRT
jgi:PhnB protein